MKLILKSTVVNLAYAPDKIVYIKVIKGWRFHKEIERTFPFWGRWKRHRWSSWQNPCVKITFVGGQEQEIPCRSNDEAKNLKDDLVAEINEWFERSSSSSH